MFVAFDIIITDLVASLNRDTVPDVTFVYVVLGLSCSTGVFRVHINSILLLVCVYRILPTWLTSGEAVAKSMNPD